MVGGIGDVSSRRLMNAARAGHGTEDCTGLVIAMSTYDRRECFVHISSLSIFAKLRRDSATQMLNTFGSYGMKNCQMLMIHFAITGKNSV